ncbi:MAG: OsmC family protein [Candidatus Poseidoniaceae archaeon]|nr:OsmC family protein [Candidatus Poseidoniaceae archaeon]
MRGEVRWTGATSMVGINDSGQELNLDWEDGPSPMQVCLQMAGACSMVDVVHALNRRDLRTASVVLDAERSEDHPRVFTRIHMTYHISGNDIPKELVERLVTSSHEKYCSVSAMLKDSAEITWSLELTADD